MRLGTEVKLATSIYTKIDEVGQGYIDRPMLRAYLEKIRSFVCPDDHFDETGFEAGFTRLDRDMDDRITMLDLAHFIGQNNQIGEIPDSFLRYSEHRSQEQYRH